MKTCCYNKNNKSYFTYGARGIRMDPNWKDDFRFFLQEMGGMPEGCTGIELINMDADFCKHNCRWVSPMNRRGLKEMPNQKNRLTNKRYRNPKRIVLTLEHEYFEFIQRQAIEKSMQKGKPISAPDFIKLILEEKCPAPKQMQMF